MSLIDIKKAATELDVSVKTVRRLAKDRKIPFTLIGRQYRFDLVAVKAALSASVAEPRQTVVQFRPRKKRTSSRFADAIGI